MDITTEERFELARLGRAIEYHIEALGIIPNFESNRIARNTHEKQLQGTLTRMKEILDAK